MKNQMITTGKANVVIGGQYGSEGKGKLYAYLYENYHIDLAICDFQPNAGHTCYLKDGTKVVSKALPLAAWFGVPCCIGPHAVFDPARLEQEIAEVRKLGYSSF